MKPSLRHLLPLAVFLAIALLLGLGLRGDPRALPSALVDKPLPEFSLPRLDDLSRRVSSDDLSGQVFVLHVWSSWCTTCLAEQPLLLDFASRSPVPVIGLHYKDAPAAGRAWLDRLGNPYRMSLHDRDGRIGLDLGVYGVPETFVVDAHGTIRLRHAGAATPQWLAGELQPLLLRLQREARGG